MRPTMHSTMHSTMRRVLVLAGLGLALSGCTVPLLGGAAPTKKPTPMPVLTAPTPSAVPPAQAPPLTVGRTTPLVTVVASQVQYVQWLLANPATGQALLAAVAVPGCPGYDAISAQLGGLLGAGALLSPSAPFLIGVEGAPDTTTTTRADGTVQVADRPEVTLTVRATRDAEQVLNTTGQVVNRIPEVPPTAFRYGLLLGPTGDWRLCEVTPVDVGGPSRPVPTIW
jgi:hypothetical protein